MAAKPDDFAQVANRGLAYWRLMEAFSPQGLPKIRPNGFPRVTSWQGAVVLPPWHPSSEFAKKNHPPKDRVFRHTVFSGLYPDSALHRTLDQCFPPDEKVFQDRKGTDTAICKFDVDKDGSPVAGSLVFSSAAWSAGLLLKKNDRSLVDNLSWMDLFDAANEDLKERFDRWTGHWLAGRDATTPSVLAADDINEMIRDFVDEVGCSALFADDGHPAAVHNRTFKFRVLTAAVGSKGDNTPDDTFINSFFLGELEKVRKASQRAGTVGKALQTYLYPPVLDRVMRRDVCVPDVVPQLFDILTPRRFPQGSWPSKDKHPLAFSQQLAVNEITARLKDGAGLFAVNGPPGTGKTTLLRDVIAMVVVGRARLLADGKHFFSGSAVSAWDITDGKYVAKVAPVNKAFYGFEIVVASSNNGAVENVTMEIPGLDAIDPSWLGGKDDPQYFPELGSALLAAMRSDQPETGAPPPKAWAMLATPLGNSTNIRNFSGPFWFPKSPAKPEHGQPVPSGQPLSFKEILKDKNVIFPTIKDALAHFREAWDAERAISERIASVHSAQEQLAKLAATICEASTALEVATNDLKLVDERRHPNYVALDQANASAAQAATHANTALTDTKRHLDETQRLIDLGAAAKSVLIADLKQHKTERPGFFANLFSFWGASRNWESKRDGIEEREREARIAFQAAELAYDRRRTEHNTASSLATQRAAAAHTSKAALENFVLNTKRRVKECEATLSKHQAAYEKLAAQVESFKKDWPDAYPDIELLTLSPKVRELSSPWLTQEWNDARNRVFLAALGLHKAYIGENRDAFFSNLSAMMDVLNGKAPMASTTAEKVADAWRTLFFVIPLLSTTFASFGKLFKHLEKEALGWLLIDEAGQAAPQMAVGALWRSRRAIVVGDPKQLEPIVNVPYPFQKAVQKHAAYQLPDFWVPSTMSVQKRSDMTMDIGTWIQPRDDKEEPLWVGAPLRVHRRCDDPMFGIANEIAYNNLMVFGTNRDDAPYSVGPISSGWIDIPFHASGGSHFNQAEYDAAKQVLQHLSDSGKINFRGDDVFLLAPFRDIADRLPDLAKPFGIDGAKMAGTIHTAQGKEAKVVIMLLGGATDGARRWAASQPNLLNVAATRAKRILVVIGSHANWSKMRNFNVAAARLPMLSLPSVKTVGNDHLL